MSGQSFAEKYRGTQWESPDGVAQGTAPAAAVTAPGVPGAAGSPGAAPGANAGAAPAAGAARASTAGAAPAAGTRSRRSLVLLLVGLVLLGGAGVGVAAVARGGQHPAGGSGAGSGAGAAGGAAIGPGASATPQTANGTPATPGPSAGTPTGPSAAPSASPGASPAETPAQVARRVLAAFDARMLVPDIAYRLSGKGTARSNKGTFRWTRGCVVVADASACTYVERSTIKGFRKKVTGKSVAVGLQLWLKSGGSGWKRTRATGAFRYAPFLDISRAREFTWVGTVTRAGVTYHRLRSNADYHPSTTKWSELILRGVVLSHPSMEILVREDGTPVSAHFTYSARGSGLRILGTSDYTFSAVGSRSLKVTPPK